MVIAEYLRPGVGSALVSKNRDSMRLPAVAGGIPVDINHKYSMRIFRGKEYLDNLEYLIKIAVSFDTGRFHSNKELSEKMMGRNMRLETGQVDITGMPKNPEEVPSITFF